jgi:hypothetical protein
MTYGQDRFPQQFALHSSQCGWQPPTQIVYPAIQLGLAI